VNWFQKVRFRVIAIATIVLIAGITIASLSAFPVWPVVGATIAAFAVAVNTFGHRLNADICFHCGHDLRGASSGEHGAICGQCGKLSFPQTMTGAGTDVDDSDESHEA
jgi:hypothetical protein